MKSFLAKHDRIRPPYSTLWSLLIIVLIGSFFMYISNENGRPVGIGFGMIIGSVGVLLFKRAFEVSDKAALNRIKTAINFIKNNIGKNRK